MMWAESRIGYQQEDTMNDTQKTSGFGAGEATQAEPKAGEMVACSRCGAMFPRSWLLAVTPVCQDCYNEETD